MNTTLILNILYTIIGAIVLFPGICLVSSFALVMSGVLTIEQGSELATFGFELYGIK